MAMKASSNPFHPGEILLEEFIIPNEWTHTYVAEQLGWTKAKLSELSCLISLLLRNHR